MVEFDALATCMEEEEEEEEEEPQRARERDEWGVGGLASGRRKKRRPGAF